MRDYYAEEVEGKSFPDTIEKREPDFYDIEVLGSRRDYYGEEVLHGRTFPTRAGTQPVKTFFREVAKAPLRGIQQSLAGIGAVVKWVGEVGGEYSHPLWDDKAKALNTKMNKKIADWGGYAAEWWREQSMKGIEAPDPAIFSGTFMQNPSWTRAAATIAGAIPSLATATAVSIATHNPILGAASLGLPEGALQYEEARKYGLSVAQSSLLGGLSTVGTTLLEIIPITRFMRGGSKKLFKDIFVGAIQEGSEEVLQALWSNAIAKFGYDNTRQLTEGMVEGLIAGAGSGGVLGGLTSGRGIQTDKLKADAVRAGLTPQEVEAMERAVENQIVDNAVKIDEVLEIAAESGKEKYEKVQTPPVVEEVPKLVEETAPTVLKQAEAAPAPSEPIPLQSTYRITPGTTWRTTTGKKMTATKYIEEIEKSLQKQGIPYVKEGVGEDIVIRTIVVEVVRQIREEVQIIKDAEPAPAQPSQPLPPSEIPGDIITEVIEKPPSLPSPSKGVEAGENVLDASEPMLTAKQRAAIHIIKRRDGVSDNDYRAIVREATGGRTDSVKDITYSEAVLIIRRLSGRAGPPKTLISDNPISPERDIYLWEQLAGPRNVIPTVWQPFSAAHEAFIKEAESIAAQLNQLRTKPHRPDMLQKYADGLIDINELTAEEQLISKSVDELVFSYIAKKLQIPKERIISRYFPHIFYQNKGVWHRWTTRLDNQQKQLVANYLDGSLSRKDCVLINKDGWKAIREIVNTLAIPDELMRLVPRELWWRHLQPRLSDAKDYRTDYWGVVRSYLYGGIRKFHMDEAINTARPYIAALPERRKAYAVRWTQKILGHQGATQKAFNDMLNNSYERFGNKASLLKILSPTRLSMDLSFFYYLRMLGFAIDSSIRNLSQTLLTTAPVVGPKNLAIGYLRLLTKEGRHTIHESAVMKEYEKLIQEYVRPLVGKKTLDRILTTTSDIFLSPFKFAEYINRGASYLAALEFQRRGGALPTKSLQIAFDLSNQSASNFAKLIELHTQYDYGVFGTSPYLQNPIYRGLFPFTSFPMKTIEFWSYQLFGRHDTKWNQAAWRGIKMLVAAGICHYIFGQIIPKYRQLREGLLGISPPAQEIDMLVRAMTGDKSDMDKFRNHFARTFPLRYGDKIQRVIDASEQGWLVYDDEGNLMYKSNPIEQVAWLLGIEAYTSNMRRQLGNRIYEEKLSRTDAYNRVYRLMHKRRMKEARDIILKHKLDTSYIIREFMRRRMEPKQMRQIRRFYPEAEARFLQEYFDRGLMGR